MPKYDYIILGAGAAGLLLADALGKDDYFASKSILVLDKDDKSKNDRTWCFWEHGKGQFDDLVHKTWSHIYVGGEQLQKSTSIAPYTYKMLRGIDFYKHYLPKVKAYPKITWVQEEVLTIDEQENEVLVTTSTQKFTGQTVFSSLYDASIPLKQKDFPVLQQHFVGWVIKTEQSVFNSKEATFMDFSVPQNGNTRFMYVLPFSENEALVEYTLFSEYLLEKSEYEEAIKTYISENYGDTKYTIEEKEFGSIPMTCYPFHQHNTDRVFHIGIAGGWAKPSTGYTFYNTSQQVPKLVEYLKTGKPLSQFYQKSRFTFYDMLLLDILYENNHLGHEIFESMFKRRKASLILKFLENETNLWEEFKIVTAPKPLPFIKALIKRIF
ncbi:lycopene cyclase family protein [Flagellimonas zhangzhouensis]|uniref:Lycopene beta-cyclase n=1 Tax=Flagellimonas zhangzhouensis TaxID=1073328 RepID=A0A1H2UCY3_9FLAO|nr:lycopene cyclase family protein [Allomuricauda zhangzhouensis]SDQ18149.1 lycopene beta-cyclase [Allomuricauda zhangzhouensis]SDW53960.1 lycopene beta-cyclase [Allomuricauda zhangzhouensis]